ncbi:MAG: GNAT family N-acetyltransferase [Clostridia bacterium]|nr:GNAT family N-acetyltransferase [Clostridia bacterium]
MNINKFDEVFKIMSMSFPKTEIGTYEAQKKLLNNPKYHLIIKENENNRVVAFMAVWKLNGFDFIEHLAVHPDSRGTGIGSKIIKEFLNFSKKPIILEIEVPNDKDENTIRRKNFYEKLNFKLNSNTYYQLPLKKGNPMIEMKLMSYPKKLNDDEFKKVEKEIQKEVYHKF